MTIQIPYVKQTWVDGSSSTPLSAARLGVLEEGAYDVSLAPAVRVYHSTTQSIPSATPTVLAFNSERFDQAGGAASTQHDNSTNNSRLTAIYAGVYLISANIEWPSAPNNNSWIRIRLNGTTNIGMSQALTDYRVLNVTTLYAMNVNDYVEVVVLQNNAGAINVSSTAQYSPEFMMVRVA